MIIESARLANRKKKKRSRSKEVNPENQVFQYYENHHIIPRSLDGNNDPINMVLLEYEEHFLAHKLLIECTENTNKAKMNSALLRMMNSAKGQQLTTSEEYAKVKEEHLKYNPFRRPEIIKMASERAKQRNKTNNPMQNPVSAKKHNDALRGRPNLAIRSTYIIIHKDGRIITILGLKKVLKYFGLKKSCSSSIIRAVQKNRFLKSGLLKDVKITRV